MRLPLTQPVDSDIVLPFAIITLFALVVIIPVVRAKDWLTVISEAGDDASIIPELLLNIKFLKVVAPVIVWAAEPLKVTVEVPAVKLLLAFVQLPLTVCVNELPLKVVPVPRLTLPFIVIAFMAVTEAVPAVVKFPLTVVIADDIVLVPLPLKVKSFTVEGNPVVAWAAPLNS